MDQLGTLPFVAEIEQDDDDAAVQAG
jgi:hypothetical protein